MSAYLVLSSALFAIGTYGVLARRNLIIVLMSLELRVEHRKFKSGFRNVREYELCQITPRLA